MDPFTYTPLEGTDSIRVLALNPSTQPDDPLSGTLQPITLTGCHFDLISGYTALSYVWGPPETPSSIFLDGKEVKITATLFEALRDLRDSTRIHYIWADALCINQNDIPERNAQVALMGDIYWTANHTVIHLGYPTEDLMSLLVVAHISRSLHRQATVPIETLHAELSGMSLDDIDLGSPGESLPSLMAEVGMDVESFKAEVKEIAEQDLLQRPWFQRVWTYQELVLSRQVWLQCGRHRAWWSDVCNLVLPLVKSQRLADMNESRCTFHNGSQGQSMSFLTGLGSSWTGLNPLHEIMYSRRGSQATDPRDMVFAFMAVHSDKFRAKRRIHIDYSQSLEEVFIAAAKYFLESAASSQVALMNWRDTITSSNLRSQLPSWVPDWGVEVPEWSPFLSGDKAPKRPIDPILRTIVFAPLGYRVIKRVSSALPRWSEYSQKMQGEILKWKKFEEARKSSQTHRDAIMAARNFSSLGLGKEGTKQWRQVVRRLWKDFVRPIDEAGDASLPDSLFYNLVKTQDLHDLYYLMDIYFPDDGEMESVLERDRTHERFQVYEATDGAIGFVLSAAQPGDLIVDACTFPPANDFRGKNSSRDALVGGKNFEDSGPRSAPDRFTTHNRRTFFVDRGGPFIIRPYHDAECDEINSIANDDFVREAPLRGFESTLIEMLQPQLVQVTHYRFVGFHHDMDENITGHCWWKPQKEEVRLKYGALVQNKDSFMQDTVQEDRSDSEESNSADDITGDIPHPDLFVIH